MADRWIPPRELDAGGLANEAASAVAADEILRAQRRSVGELHVDTGVVLREARHLAPAKDRHPQLRDPVGEDPLDLVLPQREAVVVPCGKSLMSRGNQAKPATCATRPPRGTGRRCRADRGPRGCVRAGRRHGSPRAPDRDAARRSRRRRPPAPSSPASISPVGPPPAITTVCSLVLISLLRFWFVAGAEEFGHEQCEAAPGLPQVPGRVIYWLWRGGRVRGPQRENRCGPLCSSLRARSPARNPPRDSGRDHPVPPVSDRGHLRTTITQPAVSAAVRVPARAGSARAQCSHLRGRRRPAGRDPSAALGVTALRWRCSAPGRTTWSSVWSTSAASKRHT
jgi:hypothetical protein